MIRRLMLIFGTIAVVMCAGLVVSYWSQQAGKPPGQAGVAYVETEDGELVRMDSTRREGRTLPPSKASLEAAKSTGENEEWLTRFSLTERSGKSVSSEDLQGQPYVAGFFFTSCPSICVNQNGQVKSLQEQFRGEPIRFLSISCDPEVDRPEVLREYAQRFDADEQQWLFLTGDMKYIRRVGAEIFSLGVMRQGHPEKFALMDGNGDLFGLYTWSDPAQWRALKKDIQRLLDAGGVVDETQSDS